MHKSLDLDLGLRFNGEAIIVHGGWQHPDKGRHVEKSTMSEPNRSSVSIWEIVFPDYETATLVFADLFGLTPEEASSRDSRKGVLANLKILEASIEEVPEEFLIEEETPESIFIFKEENLNLEDEKNEDAIGDFVYAPA